MNFFLLIHLPPPLFTCQPGMFSIELLPRYFFVDEALPVILFPIRTSDIPYPGIDSIVDSAACNRRLLPGRDPGNW